ncbi:Hypothetical predicted protein [Paramuricea clavata]|uniref:Uncharacterized protein n=1 Tax=Paramuricea clavata TaxID=317549 RepID=A0A6S7J3Y6_PARCT|nr:Hypothetical predicted protein [Paramuricea clavata]
MNFTFFNLKLKPDVEMYFMDPADLLKKQLKPYFQVLEFQKSHRKRLAAHYQKMGATSADPSQSSRKCQEMEREMRKLLEENNAMKKILGVSSQNSDPKNRGSSSRQGTPHSMRGVSPGQNSQSVRQRGHYNNTTPHGQVSPYSRSAPVTPQMINAMKGSQRDTPKTPAGPIRLTVRTPPSNGMIGRIGTSPSGRQRSTPGIVANLLRAGNTPGAGHESSKTPTTMRTPSRESHNSQASQQMSWSSSQHASQNNSQHQARKHGGAAMDLNRRQIHLHHQPRSGGYQ